jgi:hypothetical protein
MNWRKRVTGRFLLMNKEQIELFAALRPVVAAFEELSVPYYLGGSMASGVFGEPRQTLDADMVVALLGRHVPFLAGRLAAEYYADEPAMLRAIEHQASFNLIHLKTMVKVDVYVAWRSEFARSQFARRIRANLSTETPLEIYLASAEDTVLSKLDWYRQGGAVSDRQWRDVLGVLKVQAEALDRPYLREWAVRLNLTDLLKRALDDAGLPPEP